MSTTMGKFSQALQHLLPTGYAWPRDPQSVLIRLLDGVGATLHELDSYTHRVAQDWLPVNALARLDEWEQAVGLPDSCYRDLQIAADRRSRLLARLRGPMKTYPDSSAAALGSIEDVCASLGVAARARYNTPFRCGRDRSGGRLGQLDGRLHVILSGSEGAVFRVGSRVSARLVRRPDGAAAIFCYLQQTVPSRFEIRLIYS